MRIFKCALFRIFCLATVPGLSHAAEAPLDLAKIAFDKGDYPKAIAILQSEASKNPQNGEVQLLLAKSYLETKQIDAAVSSAEKAVAIASENSIYHQWLGQAYGEKASHASMFSAYALARKTQKEFETAVRLDEHNFDAAQNLVEYDCTAPSMVGGGEDKAQPLVQKLLSVEPAEGHYAAGNCRQAKKDYAAAGVEFAKALESHPKSAERICQIGDFFVEHGQPEKLRAVAAAGEAVTASDARWKYYRAVAWILENEKLPDADQLLREYIQLAPVRSGYPKPWEAHYWLGRLHVAEKNPGAARMEYEAALKQNSKYKRAQEALKQLGNK